MADLVIRAFAIILVGHAGSLAAAKQYARKYGYHVDPNQELIGRGVVNFGAGISQASSSMARCRRRRQGTVRDRRHR